MYCHGDGCCLGLTILVVTQHSFNCTNATEMTWTVGQLVLTLSEFMHDDRINPACTHALALHISINGGEISFIATNNKKVTKITVKY